MCCAYVAPFSSVYSSMHTLHCTPIGLIKMRRPLFSQSWPPECAKGSVKIFGPGRVWPLYLLPIHERITGAVRRVRMPARSSVRTTNIGDGSTGVWRAEIAKQILKCLPSFLPHNDHDLISSDGGFWRTSPVLGRGCHLAAGASCSWACGWSALAPSQSVPPCI